MILSSPWKIFYSAIGILACIASGIYKENSGCNTSYRNSEEWVGTPFRFK